MFARPIAFKGLLSASIIVGSLVLAGCQQEAPAPVPAPTVAVVAASPTSAPVPTSEAAAAQAPAGAQAAPPEPTIYDYTVVNIYPHDPNAFTQGLVYVDGVLYEGTGRLGQSSLRKVALETGEVLQQHDLDPSLFGEGIAVLDDRIYQITWQNGAGFVYDRDSFAELQRFSYTTEGWGLTHDGEHLIMSDGTPIIYFRDPNTLEETRRITVTVQGEPVLQLNELEYVNGKILANIWQTNYIVRIDPQTGVIDGVLDLTGLLQQAPPSTTATDVLNGIAYDAQTDRLFVTGKLWPYLFEIDLQERKSG